MEGVPVTDEQLSLIETDVDPSTKSRDRLSALLTRKHRLYLRGIQLNVPAEMTSDNSDDSGG